MPTNHAAIARETYESMVADHPPLARVVAGRLRELQDGVHPRCWVDAIFQKNQDAGPNTYDAYAFQMVMTLLDRGMLAILAPPVGRGPGGDLEDDHNNEILRGLPEPFSARFVGGSKQGSDGVLSWSRPTRFNWCPNGLEAPHASIEIPPSEVTLEVGTTESSKTLAHLFYEDASDYCGVARWPYRNEVVTILKRIPRALQVRERGRSSEINPGDRSI